MFKCANSSDSTLHRLRVEEEEAIAAISAEGDYVHRSTSGDC